MSLPHRLFFFLGCRIFVAEIIAVPKIWQRTAMQRQQATKPKLPRSTRAEEAAADAKKWVDGFADDEGAISGGQLAGGFLILWVMLIAAAAALTPALPSDWTESLSRRPPKKSTASSKDCPSAAENPGQTPFYACFACLLLLLCAGMALLWWSERQKSTAAGQTAAKLAGLERERDQLRDALHQVRERYSALEEETDQLRDAVQQQRRTEADGCAKPEGT
jgi:uncharacterized protein HemX